MWNLIDSNKIIGTQHKVQLHKYHLMMLANTKSTIKGLTPWQPTHSLSKLNNKYSTVKKMIVDKQNCSLLNRMMEIQTKPSMNTINVIPQHFPSNVKTHATLKQYERYQEKAHINKENHKILKRIESAASLYGKDRLKVQWKQIKNYRNNISRKETVADFSELAKSRVSRPRTAMNRMSPQLVEDNLSYE